jgi:hypothetical protein
MKLLKAGALVLLSACAAVAPSAWAQRDAGAVKVRRARARRAVVLTEGGRSHTLDLTKEIDAARIEDVSAPLVTRAGGFVYLVLDVCGLSKVPPDDRQCGAGVECNLVWLKLGADWRKLDAKSERYESCWYPVTSDGGVRVEGRRLSLEFDDLREETRCAVAYDADRPEQGLSVERKPLPKSTP